jgi:hypothetical protein
MANDGDGPLDRLLNIVDNLEAVIPESHKRLLDELEAIHDELDATHSALEVPIHIHFFFF